MKRFLGFTFGLFVVATLGIGTASASPIFVSNFSFENLPPGGLPNGCGTGCAYDIGAIPGWAESGGMWGQLQPGSAGILNTVPDGTTLAWSNTAETVLSQTVTPTVQLGMTYTLMVDLGHRTDTNFTASAALLINGVTYTATGVAPTAGNWTTFTATYTGTLADVGQAITIELLSGGIQANFDNVRLDGTSPVPEPGMFSLLGGGLLALGCMARRLRA